MMQVNRGGGIKRNLIISFWAIFLFFCLFFLSIKFTGNVVLYDFVVSGYENIFIFIALTFMSSFLVLQVLGGDSLQGRLTEMEAANPSSETSRSSKKGIIQRIKDKYFLSHRSVSQVDQNGDKYVANPDYLGGDSRVREYFDKATSSNYRETDGEMRKRGEFEEFYKKFMEDLNKFPKEERAQILNSLPSIESRVLYSPSKLYVEGAMSLKKIDSETGKGLIAVHKTNYLPNQKQIKATGNSRFSRSDFKEGNFGADHAAATRQTVHFSLNGPVSSHLQGNWDSTKYGVLVPLDKIQGDKIVAVRGEDTYAYGNVPLNRGGTEIVISKEAYKSMSPKELNRLKRRTGAEIVTIQSDKDVILDDAINRRIQERGYQLFSVGKDYATRPGSLDGISIDSKNKLGGKHCYSPFAGLEVSANEFVNSGRGSVLPVSDQYVEGVDRAIENLAAIEKSVRGSRRGGQLTRADIASLERQRRVVDARTPAQPSEYSDYTLGGLINLHRTDNPAGKDIDPMAKEYQLSEIRKDIERGIERSKKSRPKLPK